MLCINLGYGLKSIPTDENFIYQIIKYFIHWVMLQYGYLMDGLNGALAQLFFAINCFQ